MEPVKSPSVSEVREQMAEFLRMAREVGDQCVDVKVGQSITQIAGAVDEKLKQYLSLYPDLMSELEARIQTAQTSIDSDLAEIQRLEQQAKEPPAPSETPQRPAIDPQLPPQLREELLSRYGLLPPNRASGESVSWTAWIEDSSKRAASESQNQEGAARPQAPSQAESTPEEEFKTWSDWIDHSQVIESDKGWDEFFQ